MMSRQGRTGRAFEQDGGQGAGTAWIRGTSVSAAATLSEVVGDEAPGSKRP